MLTGAVGLSPYCMCVQPVLSTALLLLSDERLMEIPRQWGWTTYQAQATFPWWWRCSSLSHSPLILPSSFTLPLPPESNFTGSSKVAPSHLPKSQLHVVWQCQLKAPSPLSQAERMPLCSNGEYRFSQGSWKVLYNGTSPEGPHSPC